MFQPPQTNNLILFFHALNNTGLPGTLNVCDTFHSANQEGSIPLLDQNQYIIPETAKINAFR